MVGVAGFEPTTPSPPDYSEIMYSRRFSANRLVSWGNDLNELSGGCKPVLPQEKGPGGPSLQAGR